MASLRKRPGKKRGNTSHIATLGGLRAGDTVHVTDKRHPLAGKTARVVKVAWGETFFCIDIDDPDARARRAQDWEVEQTDGV